MKISTEGINFIKKWEPFKQYASLCPNGKVTIGYGHILRDSETYGHLKGGMTEKIAHNILIHDLRYIENTIKNEVTAYLYQNQHDALCSLIYNVGTDIFIQSKGLKKLNKGEYKEASDDLFLLIKGNKTPALINRRTEEKSLWNKE